jgi:hypothetical protein
VTDVIDRPTVNIARNADVIAKATDAIAKDTEAIDRATVNIAKDTDGIAEATDCIAKVTEVGGREEKGCFDVKCATNGLAEG